MPEFQVIVALSQAKQKVKNDVRDQLLSEASLRLMWLYHRLLPDLVAEARFEVGKLLLGFVRKEAEQDGDGGTQSPKSFDALAQLHVLRLLKESDQFIWSAKLGT